MSKLQLALAVRDKEYARRLADYIRGSAYAERWQLTAFTSANSCRQYLKQGFRIDILVAERELAEQLRGNAGDTPLVVLVDRLGEGNEERQLLQYQALPLFMNALETACGNNPLADRRAGSRTSGRAWIPGAGGAAAVIGVHSAVGGIGKTTFALHAAAAAGMSGLRACYVNLERWDTSRIWFGDGISESSGAGLSDLLYLVKAGSVVSGEKQIAACCRYSPLLKCDYVPGFANPEDRLTLGGEEALALVDVIASTGRYDFIVLDMDEGWSETPFILLERSDIVFEIVKDERSVIDKQQQAMRYMLLNQGERYGEVLRRSKLVCNGGRTAVDSRAFAGIFGVRESPAPLPEVPEWREGGFTPLSSSPYLAAVSRLLKQSMKEGERKRVAG